jgi:hypothetical protein
LIQLVRISSARVAGYLLQEKRLMNYEIRQKESLSIEEANYMMIILTGGRLRRKRSKNTELLSDKL